MAVEYKLIVAGGRDFSDYELLSTTLMNIAEEAGDARHISIVTGMAPGADLLGFRFATQHRVKAYTVPAKWKRPDGSTDKGAGYARNTEMGKMADGLLAFWDGESRGTKHMIEFMRSLGKPVHVVQYGITPPAFGHGPVPVPDEEPIVIPPWEGVDTLAAQKAAILS